MVYMFLANGFEETEAIAPLDLLRRAGVDIKTVAVGDSGDRKITGSHGITVTADTDERSVSSDGVDMIILPGGMPGADNLFASEYVKSMLAAVYGKGAYLAAICAAPYILGQLGYLKGKNATCYPGFEEKLTGASVTHRSVTHDGNIITANGMGSAVKFGLELVSTLAGKEEAERIASAIQHI